MSCIVILISCQNTMCPKKKATLCSQAPLIVDRSNLIVLLSLTSPRMRNSLLDRDCLCLRCKLIEFVLSK